MRFMLLVFALLAPLSASALTDYSCVSDCLRKGRLITYCQSKCSYSSPGVQIMPTAPNRMDFSCMNDCVSKGRMIGYCQRKCSY